MPIFIWNYGSCCPVFFLKLLAYEAIKKAKAIENKIENKNIVEPSKKSGLGIYSPVTFIPAYEPKTSNFSLLPGTALSTAKYQKNKCINKGIFLNIST